MLLLFLTFGLFFRGLGKLVQPDALPGPRMLLFLAVSAPFAALRNPRKALTTIHKRTILSHKRSLPLYVERLSEKPARRAARAGGTAKAERLRQNLTQEALAHAAGISLSTLRRFEKTGDIALASFVEIAFALRRMDGFDALFPEPPVHSLFEAAPRERKRARRPDAS